VPRRKLIEVSLPLEKINSEASREKSIRRGHPFAMHLWWSRKPLAAARAVLFAQLVDDPSCRPEALAIEDDEARDAWITGERDRLHRLIEELVVWENTSDEKLFARAHEEILRDTGGNPPPVLDPFAGGGSIPLEAQRLGLEAQASDLNPVAVLINKALIEIPPTFAGRPPVFPGAAESRLGDWPGATGLAEDVRRYGEWMRGEAQERIGHLYPNAVLPDGTAAPVIAWIWARTVTCPNPACRITMPLTSKWWLSKKAGKEAYVVPLVESDSDGKRVRFIIGHDTRKAPTKDEDGTIGRTGARCINCASAVPLTYVRSESRRVGLGHQLMAVVVEGNRSRVYVTPSDEHERAAAIARPEQVPTGALPEKALGFRVQAYGFASYSDLFTARQLMALTTFSDLVIEARERVLADSLDAGTPLQDAGEGARLDRGGNGPAAYADAVATYLGLSASTISDDLSSLVAWRPTHGTGATRSTFALQALPMTWDFAEANPFSGTAGDFSNTVPGTADSIQRLPAARTPGRASQYGAAEVRANSHVISTDPPYYDSIGYSDLSDYFYVWLRRSLQQVQPSLLSTLLTPKAEELVANPFRHDGKRGAKTFFESGFEGVFRQAREGARADFPVTVYYAFKQSESEPGGDAATGWETLLSSMIRAGWAVTATWPLRSERAGRMNSLGTNALASSIVLALRPRPVDAPSTDRRGFLAALRAELPDALRELQQGAIAPVDLPQAAIGPGMAVFTRYAAVLGSKGEHMTVREALQQINHLLDEVLSEQEGDFDSDTRFALTWFRQHGFAAGPFGDADNLARARNASLDGLRRAGVLTSHASAVRLLAPGDLPATWDPGTDPHLTVWEVVLHLSRVLAEGGVPAAAELYRAVPGSVDLALAKELAYLLFRIAEQRKQTADAVALNTLAAAWNEIASAATGRSIPAAAQLEFDTAPDVED
jgi:putative DNA methylase